MEVTAKCYESMDKTVKKQGSSGSIYVPISWEGKRVRVLLLEPLEE